MMLLRSIFYFPNNWADNRAIMRNKSPQAVSFMPEFY